MHLYKFIKKWWIKSRFSTAFLIMLVIISGTNLKAYAQLAPALQTVPRSLTLKQAFEAAWARQPEAASLLERRNVMTAQKRSAQAWIPEPAAVEVSGKTDNLNQNQGAREYEIAVALPLWLPGERSRSIALAQAQSSALESQLSAAQLRVAAVVREAWWQWQRSQLDLELAHDQVGNARRLSADVAKRVKAGELARADQYQAESAVALGEFLLSQAEVAVWAAQQQLHSLTGLPVELMRSSATEIESEPAVLSGPAAHAGLQQLRDQALVAQRSVALAAVQSRTNPELTVATTRERGSFDERYQQTVSLGIRIPFGSSTGYSAKLASARAEEIEANAQLALQQQNLKSEQESAQMQVEAARFQLVTAQRRAQFARESRNFFEKSFRLGEADLPTRLRVEAEAVEAERQAARARLEVAASLSFLQQTLGYLPQ